MIGKAPRGHVYYTCEPHKNLGPKAKQLFPEHPPSVYVREDELLTGIFDFIGERVFGPDRTVLLAQSLGVLDQRSNSEARERREALLKALEEISKRQARQVLALERDDDPEGLLFQQVRDRLYQLDQERREIEAKLEAMKEEISDEAPDDPNLLDLIPNAKVRLADAPESVVRDLFQALNLAVRFNRATNLAAVEIVLEESKLGDISSSSAVAFSAPREIQTETAKNVAVVFSAPNGKHKAWVTHKVGRGSHLLISATFPVPKIADARRRLGQSL